MERIDKIKLAIERGYTCDAELGKVYGINGREILTENKGYRYFQIMDKGKRLNISTHHFIWYCVNKNSPEFIDHISRVRADSKMKNLRVVSKQQNNFNKSNVKGYYKRNGKFCANIMVDYKNIYLGDFDTEQEAHDAYIKAKLLHHII